MKRDEAIRRIVWCLLRHADTPDVAVATAATLQHYLGEGYERQMTFTNLLRGAGLFAKDEDGYFMRYRHSGTLDDSFLEIPEPNYLLTFPVPVEPRMRIAYNVFVGLLLKYLYQTQGVVPIEVSEGSVRLWSSGGLPDAVSVWCDFQKDDRTIASLKEGVETTLVAIKQRKRRIGTPQLSAALAQTPLLGILEAAIKRHSRMFQSQNTLKVKVVGKKAKGATQHAPFTLLQASMTMTLTFSTPSHRRCIICGSTHDLFEAAQTLLPETKQFQYDTITERHPPICSNCAFIAYLSGVYPSPDLSIVEFPADNFLELFALYETLQGVSALVALKYVNRVANLSVLPNRYLLLSHKDGQGRMDGKAQVYLQLREQTHLLRYVDRPMRVQIEGSIPQMWSEVFPHVAIGLSHFRQLPPYYETQDSARKGFAYEVIRALQEGQPYKAVYVAVEYSADKKGGAFERQVFTKDLAAYETFIDQYHHPLAKSLGGETMCDDVYKDVKEFSDYLFDLLHPLVQREVRKSGSSVSGIARKYTDLVLREFGEGMAGKFLYTVCQEADQAERDGDGRVKHNTFTKLYGGNPNTKNKSPEEVAKAWREFRQTHPVQLEEKLRDYQCRYGTEHATWQKFLREVQARTLALLMLNVRQQVKTK
ncbi:hypothetical protein [Thermodesulfitimonas autotrophica]|uniref:hypothetical protein n=1 Tax=Thermodesulfitimonas autotrophica TaxID=1894989 RepID=UPI002FE07AAE